MAAEIVFFENHAFQSFEEQQQDEVIPRLSFSSLLSPRDENVSGGPVDSPARPDPLFEFFTSQTQTWTAASGKDDVLFCGKVIGFGGGLNEYQKRDYFANKVKKSQSLRKLDENGGAAAAAAYSRRRIGASSRLFSSDMDHHATQARVNITSLTSMSAKARRRMFMFGLVKVRPEMELSAIKQRLARLPPPPPLSEKGVSLSPVEVVGPSLRGRSCLLAGLLTRSFRCIP